MTVAADTTLVWGAPDWFAAAAGVVAVMLALLAWGYWRAGATPGVRALAIGLKVLAVLVLAACLLEPLFSGTRARPGANQFVVLADDSKSMSLHENGTGDDRSRGERVRALGESGRSGWLNRLAQDFDLRQYAFDTQLRAIANLGELSLEGGGSNLGASLDRLARRYQGRPLAGVLLFTDGNATDPDAVARVLARAKSGGPAGAAGGASAPRLPPIYPVAAGRSAAAPRDVNLEGVTVTQTNFEDAPVTLLASVTTGGGYDGRTLAAEVLDEAGKVVERQTAAVERDGRPLTFRFRLRPEQPGVSFYRVRVAADGEAPPISPPASTSTSTIQTQPAPAPVAGGEVTLANNSRLVAVDRGQGPYRVLYVAGRPNWEFKFLQRALVADGQVELVGLIRLAKREPKFNFIGRFGGEDPNPLFRGFDNADPDVVEQHDQPVIVRFNATDEAELRGGFPKTADELFAYHAVILDDVESEFFTQDQMQLLNDFVRHRGGGLLMAGGQESFRNGRFERTPVGDMLPVYADGPADAGGADADAGTDVAAPVAFGGGELEGPRYRLELTREGRLEPWVRLRADEDAEQKRVDAMPAFRTLNRVRGIKPGATVLARATVGDGGSEQSLPALVEQRFGAGRVAALLIGDLWRWGLRKPEDAEDDLPKAWRQTVRWLVAEVPKRVEVVVAPAGGPAGADDPDAGAADAAAVAVRVRVRDAAYAPLDNASAAVRVTAPDGTALDLTAEPSAADPGVYVAAYVPRQPGAYRAEVTATGPDGAEVGRAQAGWTSDPAAEEFRKLEPDHALLERLARETGGQVVDPDDLDAFVESLPARRAEITEPYVQPVWHQPWVFLLAIVCLAGEWGLRRWKGLP